MRQCDYILVKRTRHSRSRTTLPPFTRRRSAHEFGSAPPRWHLQGSGQVRSVATPHYPTCGCVRLGHPRTSCVALPSAPALSVPPAARWGCVCRGQSHARAESGRAPRGLRVWRCGVFPAAATGAGAGCLFPHPHLPRVCRHACACYRPSRPVGMHRPPAWGVRPGALQPRRCPTSGLCLWNTPCHHARGHRFVHMYPSRQGPTV